ncbi:MAG: 23S rRNA (guanosine(2251)-2'-O)-methyltransferase RlmB [Spirochaetia bacterium]|nr:23S rRNA (guanosine(2251)-2'-O)-methyltransferase RlmB [Spirochaetia bacterium]
MSELVIGYHPIEEALKTAGPSSLLYIDEKPVKRNSSLEKLAVKGSVRVKRVPASEIEKMVGRGVKHKGAVLVYSPKPAASVKLDLKGYIDQLKDKKDALVLVLDGITDPQNLGAIIRSADLFAVDMVIVPERRSAQQSTTVMKVSAGASRYVPVISVKNLVREMQQLQEAGFWFYGADMGGDPVHTVTMKGRVGLVLGSEGEGIGRLVKETCDKIIAIPMAGHIDSLNVSVAAGILLYEVRRGTEF